MIPKLRLQQGQADRNGYLMAFLLTMVIIGRLLVDCLLGKVLVPLIHGTKHGLGTPNESINQRYLKNWANVADKICLSRT